MEHYKNIKQHATPKVDEDLTNKKYVDDTIQANAIGKETVLYDGSISATGTYTLTDDVNNYDFIIINYSKGLVARQSNTLTKKEISVCVDEEHTFSCIHGNGSDNYNIGGYFNNNELIINTVNGAERINSITGYKFGRVTVENTITNPLQPISYSLDEQLTGGTWIDGKPIYRKVIVSTFGISTGSSKTITLSDFGVNNVDTPISFNFLSSDGTNKGLRITKLRGDFVPSQVTITNVTSNWNLASGEQKLVIEYTKTTD